MSQAAETEPELSQQVRDITHFLMQSYPIPQEAQTLVIAGSGLGGLANKVKVLASVSFADIPHVGGSTVAGHDGRLLVAQTTVGATFLILKGRRHLYEGISVQQSTLLLRALLVHSSGIQNVIISNAAGGLNATFDVGDLMLISDHINWSFRNPLIGRNDAQWGDRFPDMSEAYSKRLRVLAREEGLKAGTILREGVYVAGQGPNYETRAEFFMLRETLGGDAVGMSTVPEVLVARHAGREVLGISFISNSLVKPAVTSHEEVMENSKIVEDKFSALVLGLVDRLRAA